MENNFSKTVSIKSAAIISVTVVIVIIIFQIHFDNFILETIALAVSISLGISAGSIRKLYDKEKLQNIMLNQKHNALLKEVEERSIAGQRVMQDKYFLKTMSDSSLLGILATDNRNDEILYCNHKLSVIWKIEKYEEMINSKGVKCSELIRHCASLAKDADAFYKHYRPLADENISDENIEDESTSDIQLKDGRIIRCFTSRISGQNCEYLGRLFMYEDVTEQKQKNETLLANEERFRLLVQNSADIISIIDGEGNYKYNSQASERILGYKVEERLGMPIFGWMHPDDIPKIQNTLNLLKDKTSDVIGPQYFKVKHADGSWVYLESIFTNQMDNPAINGIVINSRDFTQHFSLQEALRNSRNFLNAIINSASDPMFVKDSSHRYVIVNDAFCRLTGYKREEMLGKSAYELFPREEADNIFSKNERVLNMGEMGDYEISFTDAQNKKHVVASNLITFQEESGEKYVIGNVRDETRRKELETEINNALIKEKDLSEMKSKFISMVSHEYRTPLTAILSSTELLELFGTDMTFEEKQDHLEEIKKTVKFMVTMLNEVLLINRAESGRMEYNPSQFELLNFCRELLKSFIDESKCRVELVPGFSDRNVVMDKGLLRHILINLISNAVKYSSEGGTVRLNIQSNDGYVNFEIKDNGIGIPKEDQAKLFQPFFRANNALNIPGSGLGLSIVKYCTDLHKGQISFESLPGEGAKFLVSLPDETK